MRGRVLDAVLAAQALAGGPVTSQEARLAAYKIVPLTRHARSFTELARAVSQMGPDARGRVLHRAGVDRKGFALWWVEEPNGRQA